jgi:uncharacterized membrane protein
MGDLVVAAVIWVGLHLVVSGTRVRDGLVRRLGERGFYWAFSLASVAAIGFLVHSWSGADTTLLWVAPGWLRWVLVAVMLVAFFFFVASNVARQRFPIWVPEAEAESVVRCSR